VQSFSFSFFLASRFEAENIIIKKNINNLTIVMADLLPITPG
tara:strand:- start:249 stop:374 length:126 start_codon:yes stop_codon:yes gene_type:complete